MASNVVHLPGFNISLRVSPYKSLLLKQRRETLPSTDSGHSNHRPSWLLDRVQLEVELTKRISEPRAE